MSTYVLIIAPEDDAHAQVVAKRIESLKAKAVILDAANFPSQWQLSARVENDQTLRFVLSGDGIELNEGNLAGVWWRRPRRHLASSDVQESHFRQFISIESHEAFDGWLQCLHDRVINPIDAELTSSHKLRQLQCAVEVGLSIPKSLATNSPGQARMFYAEYAQKVVFKPFTGTHWQCIATQGVSVDVLNHLDSVAYSPVIFQQEILKVADIRVNIIDGQVFATMIRTKRDDPPLDWRIDPDREYTVHTLPTAVEKALVELLAKLGLRFAACDLALTTEGDYIFFEVNPGGQWLFVEIMTGQEISHAFAKALTRQPPS